MWFAFQGPVVSVVDVQDGTTPDTILLFGGQPRLEIGKSKRTSFYVAPPDDRALQSYTLSVTRALVNAFKRGGNRSRIVGFSYHRTIRTALAQRFTSTLHVHAPQQLSYLSGRRVHNRLRPETTRSVLNSCTGERDL